MRPEGSALVHTDVRGRVWLPVHWATFNLAYHDWDEPIKRTLAAAKKHNIRLLTPRIGTLIDVIKPAANEAWWETVGP